MLTSSLLLADEGFASERPVQEAVFEAAAAAAISPGAHVGRLFFVGGLAGASVRWGAVRSAPIMQEAGLRT